MYPDDIPYDEEFLQQVDKDRAVEAAIELAYQAWLLESLKDIDTPICDCNGVNMEFITHDSWLDEDGYFIHDYTFGCLACDDIKIVRKELGK